MLLIAVDTLRPDHLGAYGYDRPTSPEIDRFVGEAVVFDDVQASSAWTLPSFATLFTSLDPAAHRAIDLASRLSAAHTTLAEVLAENGYRTAAVVSHHFLAARYGLAQGFRDYDETLAIGMTDSHRAISSTGVNERALAWLRDHGRASEVPWFLFLHYFDPHHDYLEHPEITEPFGDGILDDYDGEIAFTDMHIGRVLSALAADGLERETIVVFISDHGEEFGEHGREGHGRSLHAEVTQLALAIRAPGIAPHRVADPVHAVDLVPTLLELVGLEGEGGEAEGSMPGPGGAPWMGRSLVPAMRSGAPLEPRPRIAQTSLYRDSVWNSYRLGRHALFERQVNGRPSEFFLYDVRADEAELHDVAALHPQVVSEYARGLRDSVRRAFALGKQIRSLDGDAEDRVDLAPHDVESLRALGYLE